MKKVRKKGKILRHRRDGTTLHPALTSNKWSYPEDREYIRRKLGTFGAASPVRILVKDGMPVSPETQIQKSANPENPHEIKN
jgi:hypothetical protein